MHASLEAVLHADMQTCQQTILHSRMHAYLLSCWLPCYWIYGFSGTKPPGRGQRGEEAKVIYSFTNSKGGVGKSTLAVHLVLWLVRQGRSVALIDADAQGSSSIWLQEASPETPVFRWLSADDILDGVPALRDQFEFVVADGPAGLSEVTRTIMFLTDATFLPIGPSVLDLRAVTEAVRVVRQVQAIRQGPPRAMIVPNKVQARTRLSRELLETAHAFGLPTATGLRLRQCYADAAGQGKVVWQMGPQAADAARDMESLLEEMVGYGRAAKNDEPGLAAC